MITLLRLMKAPHVLSRTLRMSQKKRKWTNNPKSVRLFLVSSCRIPMPFVCLVTSTQREPVPEQLDISDGETERPSTSRISHKRKRIGDSLPADTASSSKASTNSNKRKHRRRNGDAEYGVSRGVDFVDVSCVINFDLPSSARSYTHRIGRTARAGRSGIALSFVVPREQWGRNKVVGCVESSKEDERVFARVEREQGGRGSQIKEYRFDLKQVEAFRYRMEDALRAVTRSAIKEARIKELKTEILTSEKLKVCDMTF